MPHRRAPFHTDATNAVSAAIHRALEARYAAGLGPDSPRRFSPDREAVVHCIATTHIQAVGGCWQLIASGLSVMRVKRILVELRELAADRVRAAESGAAASSLKAYRLPYQTLIVDCSAPPVHQSSPRHCHQARQTIKSGILKACIQQVLNWNLLVRQGDTVGWPCKPADAFKWGIEDAVLALRTVASEMQDDLEALWDDLTDECGLSTSVSGVLLCATRRTAAEALLGPAVVRTQLAR